MTETIAHGIDLVDCNRIERMIERHGERFTAKIFTEKERAYSGAYKDSAERLAGRFAAKEAILKLIGTGLRGKLRFRDIEIENNHLGRPIVNLTGHVKKQAEALGIKSVSISITHTANLAMASAVALIENGDGQTEQNRTVSCDE